MDKHVHSRFIYNVPKLEPKQMTINRKMYKNVISSYSVIVHKSEKEQTITTCNNMDESHGHDIRPERVYAVRICIYCIYEVQEKTKLTYSDKANI